MLFLASFVIISFSENHRSLLRLFFDCFAYVLLCLHSSLTSMHCITLASWHFSNALHAFILLVSENPEGETVEPEAEFDASVEVVEPEETQGKQLSILKYLSLQVLIL